MFVRPAVIVRRVFVILLLSVFSSAGFAAKHALVIGNDSYEHISKLQKARADARSMAQVLKKIGFSVTKAENLNNNEMRKSVRDFIRKLKGGDEVVFFYSGHGVQINNANFLLPTNIKGVDAFEVRDEALSLQRLLEDIAATEARFTLAIVDACRDNPFQSMGKNIGVRGLASTNPATGQMVIYSAGTNQQALDRLSDNDPNPNSVFTRSMLEELSKGQASIREVIQNVRQTVVAKASQINHQQVPAIYDQLIGDFYIGTGEATSSAGVAQSSPQIDVEQEAWLIAKEVGSRAGYESFLSQYPNGRFSGLAKLSMKKFEVATLDVVPHERSEPASVPVESWRAGKVFRDCSDCPEMVVIPSGSFRMGDLSGEGGSYEKPVRRVNIESFAMGTKEVSFAQWDACVDEGGCSHRPNDNGWGRGNMPVMRVSWHDITKEFIPWIRKKTGKDYRLPSEAEWEYAARARTETEFWWGNSINTNQANYDGSVSFNGSPKGEYRQKTVSVDSFEANPFGLYNVHGNVWEWVQDCWNRSLEGTPSDGRAMLVGDCTVRVLRGGSWISIPVYLRSAVRGTNNSDYRGMYNGFRLARTK